MPESHMIKNGDTLVIGSDDEKKVKIPMTQVVAVVGTGIRSRKNYSDILLADGSRYRVSVMLKRAIEKLGLTRVHRTAAVKLSQVKCLSRNTHHSQVSAFVKVSGHHQMFPVSRRSKLISLAKKLYKPCD